MKNIIVYTSDRADFGILKELIIRLESHSKFNLNLIISGSHLNNKKESSSYREIVELNIKNTHEISTYVKSKDDFMDISKSMSLGLQKYPKTLSEINGDILILLGDRFETLIAAICATLIKLPIAHIHGGDISEGAFDESFRHSITKMSHIHFPATKESAKVIEQLGEKKDNIFNVGSMAVDNIIKYKLRDISEISKEFNFNFCKPYCLITYHSCTLGEDPLEGIKSILLALKKFNNLNYVFTYPNPDNGGQIIIDEIAKFVNENKELSIFIKNFGQLNYFSILNSALFVLGNSSSGLIEAPYFNTPTVDIGKRQNGRIKGNSVLNVDVNVNDIFQAIKKVQSKKNKLKPELLYGNGGSTDKIIGILENLPKPAIIKKFNKIV